MKKSNFLRYHFIFQVIIDLIIVGVFFFVFLYFQYGSTGSYMSIEGLLRAHYKAFFIFEISWFLIAGNVKLYDISRFTKPYQFVQKLTTQLTMYAVILILVSGVKSFFLFSYKFSLLFLVVLLVVLFCCRIVYIFIANRYRIHGTNGRNVIFVDNNHNTNDLISIIKSKNQLGLNICGRFLADMQPDTGQKIYSFDLEDCKKFVVQNDIDIIFISMSGKISNEAIENLITWANGHNRTLNFIPSVFYDDFASMKMDYYGIFPVLVYNSFPLDNRFNRYVKRIFDLIFSLLMCVFVLWWLVPIIAIAIKLDSKGDVFYMQPRIGFKGRKFKCLKFRSMCQSSDNDIKSTEKDDKRITRVGKFLRRTSLDEFPQFFNVLLGNMSVVGPRPHMKVEDDYYKKTIRKYYLRHHVPPGITGMAQANGLRGAVNCEEEMARRIAADTFYVRNWSLVLDIYIIFKTFFRLLKKDEKAY
ncbi:MAG: exopolysaccharide biosynthesis polyprenyl glycosylphosphotransferase [Prevotellaceae bacterium]|jgi:putative colanic acid biosynthesis UDP-glucose lipid carrier transferase|nr:exopolysaccharide biosynthesis polyprenyl glycosylphosphotransferase [Prevotellaceae bacterium]